MTAESREPPSPLDHWFAFVESQDRFRATSAGADDGDWWGQVLIARLKEGLPAPSRIAWLSCIRAQYFEGLSWRDEACEIGDEEQSARRRVQLLTLNPADLAVIPLLLCGGEVEEIEIFRTLGSHDWHRIRLADSARYPVWMAPDYALENDGRLIRLDHLGACPDAEREALRKVFNLDFLRDDDLGGEDERGTPAPTLTPEPEQGLEKRLPEYEWQRHEELEGGAS